MPSSATITSFYSFAAGTLIRSARVNTNFSVFRGHLLPVDPNTALAASTLTYDLGADDHMWMNNYSGVWVALAQSTPASNPSTTTKYKVYMKADGGIYKLTSAGTESPLGGSGAGGGGGSSIIWEELANAPIKSTENNMSVYTFQQALGQALYTEVYVPSTYVTGTACELDIPVYTTDDAGTMHFIAECTLIRAGDSIGASANIWTTTNAAIDVTSTITNIRQIVTLDLGGAGGTIGTALISQKATIAIKLYRKTDDTMTDDAKFLHKQSELRTT
jgi:hypothetical protein